VFFHRLGELRDRSFENQAYRASGLNLLVAAIILWNTRYLQTAFDALRSRGAAVLPELVRHIARSAGNTSVAPATTYGRRKPSPVPACSGPSASDRRCWRPEFPKAGHLAGCGNSPTSCGERHVVAVVEPEFASDGAVWLEIGVSVPEHFGTLVAAVEVEVGSGRAVPALQPDLDCAELNLATIAGELDVTRTEHVDILRVPAFNLGDPPRPSTWDGRDVVMPQPPTAWAGVRDCRPPLSA